MFYTKKAGQLSDTCCARARGRNRDSCVIISRQGTGQKIMNFSSKDVIFRHLNASDTSLQAHARIIEDVSICNRILIIAAIHFVS
jgi:hypothetical protein